MQDYDSTLAPRPLSTPPVTIEDLEPELLEIVFDFLAQISPLSVPRASLVCRKWHRIPHFQSLSWYYRIVHPSLKSSPLEKNKTNIREEYSTFICRAFRELEGYRLDPEQDLGKPTPFSDCKLIPFNEFLRGKLSEIQNLYSKGNENERSALVTLMIEIHNLCKNFSLYFRNVPSSVDFNSIIEKYRAYHPFLESYVEFTIICIDLLDEADAMKLMPNNWEGKSNIEQYKVLPQKSFEKLGMKGHFEALKELSTCSTDSQIIEKIRVTLINELKRRRSLFSPEAIAIGSHTDITSITANFRSIPGHYFPANLCELELFLECNINNVLTFLNTKYNHIKLPDPFVVFSKKLNDMHSKYSKHPFSTYFYAYLTEEKIPRIKMSWHLPFAKGYTAAFSLADDLDAQNPDLTVSFYGSNSRYCWNVLAAIFPLLPQWKSTVFYFDNFSTLEKGSKCYQIQFQLTYPHKEMQKFMLFLEENFYKRRDLNFSYFYQLLLDWNWDVDIEKAPGSFFENTLIFNFELLNRFSNAVKLKIAIHTFYGLLNADYRDKDLYMEIRQLDLYPGLAKLNDEFPQGLNKACVQVILRQLQEGDKNAKKKEVEAFLQNVRIRECFPKVCYCFEQAFKIVDQISIIVKEHLENDQVTPAIEIALKTQNRRSLDLVLAKLAQTKDRKGFYTVCSKLNAENRDLWKKNAKGLISASKKELLKFQDLHCQLEVHLDRNVMQLLKFTEINEDIVQSAAYCLLALSDHKAKAIKEFPGLSEHIESKHYHVPRKNLSLTRTRTISAAATYYIIMGLESTKEKVREKATQMLDLLCHSYAKIQRENKNEFEGYLLALLYAYFLTTPDQHQAMKFLTQLLRKAGAVNLLAILQDPENIYKIRSD